MINQHSTIESWHRSLILRIYLLCFFMFQTMTVYAQSIAETQHHLHQLDHRIGQLKQTLSQDQITQENLQTNVVQVATRIHQHQTNLAAIQEALTEKQAEVTRIEQAIAKLNQRIQTLQEHLAQDLRSRYQHPSHPSLSWLLLHDHRTADKVLTYYHYVIRARQETLAQLQAHQKQRVIEQEHLRQALRDHQKIQTQWDTQDHALRTEQERYQILLTKITNHIQTQENQLTLYQKNRLQLSEILHQLSQASVIQTRHSMTQMKHQLPNPLSHTSVPIEKYNQGILLYSPEKTPVHAIYPGKIVFCEWLNGYGLLMIIDHGWGFMSLYANNLALLKQKGDTVLQGETIATVGHSGTVKQSGLYFELRLRGKALPPLDWLNFKP